jgi:hypothetical protein
MTSLVSQTQGPDTLDFLSFKKALFTKHPPSTTIITPEHPEKWKS